jgi:signal transduction histidine kinase
MRTPLNAILGYDRLALDTDSAELRTDYLKKIGAAGETLLSLINDTLDLQKIENGVTTLHPAPVPCSAVVESILTAVKPLLEAKTYTLSSTTPRRRGRRSMPTPCASRKSSSISSATRQIHAGGRKRHCWLWSALKETDDELCDKLIVRDSGVGISESFLPKIYEPFAQERTEKTAGIGGSGLGLSIVKRLVDLMHGRIEVKSKLGEGTEFTVYLTFKKAADTGGSYIANPAAEDHVRAARQNDPLCEDNEMNREIATAILEKRK